MDGSDKAFSSSTSSKPIAFPKFSPTDAGEADENEMNYDKMASKLLSPKKPPTKNFMSPTISATSKAAPPRKKILAERNEISNFAETHHRIAPSLDSKSAQVNLGIDESGRCSSDSSSKPYDPLTNYLSPRPKYLRFKPNRRCEIFSRQETEIGGEENDGYVAKKSGSLDSPRAVVKADSLADSHSSSVSASQEDSINYEEKTNMTEDEHEADEEIEEFEVEKCLSLKAVLKFLLLFISLFSSTLYISSMNSSTPPPVLQAMWDLKYEYHKIHVFHVVAAKIFEGTRSGFSNQTASDGDVRQAEMKFEDNNKEFLLNTDKLDKGVEMRNEKTEVACDHELDEALEDPVERQGAETTNVEDVCEAELEKEEEASIAFHREESESVNDQYFENTKEGYNQMKGIKTVETGGKSEPLQDHQIPSIYGFSDHHEELRFLIFKDDQVEDKDKIERSEGILVEGAGKEVVENIMERVEGITENADSEIFMPEGLDIEENPGEVNSIEVIIEHSKSDLIPGGATGILIFSVLVIASVLGIHLRSMKNSTRASPSMENPHSEFVIPEETNSVEPVLPNVEEEHIEKAESASPSSLIHSTEEASKDFYRSRAPTVELIGEIVFGEVVSSSIKSCGMESKTMEIEYSVSREMGLQSKAASEFSTMNSPSYGSFTAEKKIVKREEVKDGEARVVVTTPVRRSSRIRNRSVLSP